MKPLLKFEHFRLIREAEENLEVFLDNIYESSLNENIGAALGSPVKFTKIKNNAKAYQKALVQQSINNLDFEKKVAAGTLDPKQKEVLAAANKQKNQALKDETAAIGQRMDQLATTAGLKTVSSIAKNKSALAAAQISAKVADGEEAKALKLKIQGLNKKISANQEELEEYKDKADGEQTLDNVKTDSGETLGDKKAKEDKAKADEEKAKADEEKAKADKVAANAKIEEFTAKKEELKSKTIAPEDKAGEAQNNLSMAQLDLQIAKLKKDDKAISAAQTKVDEFEQALTNIKSEESIKGDVDSSSKEGKLERLKNMLTKAKESGNEKKIKEVQDLIDKVSANESWQLENTELGRLIEAEIDSLSNQIKLNESNQYIGESVSEKFRYLINKNK